MNITWYEYGVFRKSKFLFGGYDKLDHRFYRYYETLSERLIIQYLAANWYIDDYYQADRDHFIIDLKKEKLLNQELELIAKI